MSQTTFDDKSASADKQLALIYVNADPNSVVKRCHYSSL